MDDSDEDQRLPHKQNPDKPVSLQQLRGQGLRFMSCMNDEEFGTRVSRFSDDIRYLA